MGKMRRGIVIDGRGAQVLVRFDDADGVVSAWLDVAQSATIGKKTFHRFKRGEMVRCYLDKKGESGEAIYAIYNDADPTPGDDDDIIYEEHSDGSIFERGAGLFRYTNAQGTIFEVVGDEVKVTGNLKVVGDLTVTGKTDLRDTDINGIGQVGT